MELEVKYNPDISQIDVLKDVKNILNQLSECYNSKIHDLEYKIECLQKEREAINKAIKNKNYEQLEWYL